MKHLALAAFLLIPLGALAQEHADHQTMTAAPAPAAPNWAKMALEKSPRHREWVNLKNSSRTVSAFVDGTAVGKAIRDLPPDQVTADLNAVADYVSKLPAANGKVAVAGFCWGGGQSFRFATNRPSLAAAFVFYGQGPESADAIAAIK